MMQPSRQNRLARESSPYLRQHAGNPVDWFPWGDEAMQKARAEDKPIFLSIGYSSCHWCHVMEHESFEREEVGELMNRHFVCVKVDREEHPDIDSLYMAATQLLTQRGGWPNSVWLTPDGRPWYAGTYFPREDRHGRPGFMTLLQRLSDLWQNRRADVEKQADQMTEAIRRHHGTTPSTGSADHTPVQLAQQIQDHYRNQYDPRYSGFGHAPKFPPHAGILLLLRTMELASSPDTRIMVERTLSAMMCGGIYDQIGGGFHRYSTDDKWLLPHFEKMLYDNALLLKAYAKAATAFNDSAYRRIALETAEWLNREMTHPDGGFYSALDADSEGEEGKYYTWSYDELVSILDQAALSRFCEFYHLRPEGNFTDEATRESSGLNIPHRDSSSHEADARELDPVRATLLEKRNQRVRPGLDDKIITAWNGLMISALAVAGRELNEQKLINRAIRARSFIAGNVVDGDILYRTWCGNRSSIAGYLEDYAAIALADLDLFESTGQQQHLDDAYDLVNRMLALFYDADSGELYMSTQRHNTPLMRIKDVYDQGSPSGTGLAVQALVRAGMMRKDTGMVATGIRIARQHLPLIQRAPSAVATLVEGFISANDDNAAPTDAPDIQVKLTPVEGDQPNRFILSFDIPNGWHLNEMTGTPTSGNQWFEIKTDVENFTADITVSEAGKFTWQIDIHIDRPIVETKRKINLMVRYQPCTTDTCLLVQQTVFPVMVK